MPRDRLYPAVEPRESGFLTVGTPHRIYWEECGKANGEPVCFLHGGPGAGAAAGHRRFFDPEYYRVILHDQRGAGRSTPVAGIENNTTQHLVEDIETLRKARGVKEWIVFGGSWGSSLALAYAEAYPERCKALVLRGIFLCREREVDWFLYGMGRFFPEAREAFESHIPPGERHDLLKAYLTRLTDPDSKVHLPAARIWSRYEAVCSTLMPNRESVRNVSQPDAALSLARLEAHYFANRLFLQENALLDNAYRLTGIPGAIVQGRYDVVCPPESAAELAAVWPDADLEIVPDAGHSATEPGIMAALVRQMEKLKELRAARLRSG